MQGERVSAKKKRGFLTEEVDLECIKKGFPEEVTSDLSWRRKRYSTGCGSSQLPSISLTASQSRCLQDTCTTDSLL
jgi:hypothetical protein